MNLQQLVAHHFNNAPGFQARVQAAGLQPEAVQTAGDLVGLPVIRKDDLVRLQAQEPPFGGFLSCPPGELKRIFQSPGPIYDPESRRDDYWRWESALRAAGFEQGDVVLNAFGYHLTPAGAMFEEGLWAVGCAVIPGGVGNQEQQVQLLHTLKVNGYTGLPSYLMALLEKAAEMGLELALEKAFVTAEPLPPSLRGEINARGVTIRQGYGTAECGNLGYECEQQDGWHLPDDAIIDVCDINSGKPLPPGETGEIVVTLFTEDYALVRFGTGDLSALNVQPCACGRKSSRLVGWLGRVGAAVKVRGMFLHPRQVDDLARRFPEIRACQAVITRSEHRDQLSLRIAVGETVNEQALLENVQQTARQILKFRLDEVELVSEADIPGGYPLIDDQRTWD